MSDRILSPDGKMMWSGSDWIPLPVQSSANVQDSVVMGDINTKIEHSVHNTYSQDTEKMVRNHLHIAAEKMAIGQFDEADAMFEKAKQIDYHLAVNLYNEEFTPIFVDSLWRELDAFWYIHSTTIPGTEMIDRINRIHELDMNHIPSLLLSAKILRVRTNTQMSRSKRLDTAKKTYNRILLLDPANVEAINGIIDINRMKKIESIFYLFVVGLIILFVFT